MLGNKVTVPPGLIAEIEKLCDTMSREASPFLKGDIRKVKADLRKRELLEKFGVEVAKPRAR